MRPLAMSKPVEPRSATSLPEKLIKIDAKVVSHGRYVTFRMAEVAVPRQMFREIFVAHRPVAGNPRQRHPQVGVRYDTQI
jgi:hypothetical protein